AVGNRNEKTNLLDPNTYGISEEELKDIPASWLVDDVPSQVESGYDFVQLLREIYTGKISFEYDHVNSEEERKWMLDRIEHGTFQFDFSDKEKKQLLNRIRSEEHTSELQSRFDLVCRLLLEKKT